MSNVAAWLAGIGLAKYAETFAAHEVDFDTLLHLTEEDLKELGLPLGPRRKVLAAIEALARPAAPTPVVNASRSSGSDAERRQLTVMFVDLVESTKLAGELDPEEMREVIRAVQNAVAGEIARFDGHVAQFLGDGVLAYFGWPRAHENEAERAVRAGLGTTAAVARLRAPSGAPLAVRIGIATGLVVVGDLVGDGAARQEAVTGEAPNLAARLQQLAEPGQIVLADGTRRLLGEMFDLVPLGARSLKGIAAPVPVFAVVGERHVESRFAARVAHGLLPMVGREQELALLLERWRRACAGEGQMVLLAGEAGIGKSRIVQALIDQVAPESHVRIRYQCSPYHTDSALHPVIQQLTLAAGFAADDTHEARLDKLESVLRRATAELGEPASLIATLVGLDGQARYGAHTLSPQQQRNRVLKALTDQLTGLARRQAVLFIVEDAHWIDPTTLELIDLTLDAIGASPVLMLVTARPSFEHGFGGHPIVTRLTLNRLGRDHITAIVSRITGGKTLPDIVLDQISARTDGVPLFVEEMAKAVLESGRLRETEDAYLLDHPISVLAIPTSLHDSLMARLDRLQPVKEVAQVAAVIGRTFDYRTLAAISPRPEPELAEALDRLVEAELIFRRGAPPEASYLFKHALVRDAAYESLLKTRRQTIHRRLLEELKTQPATAPEILAHHAQEAGLSEPAIDYWQQAGQQALLRPAYREAIGHFGNALRLVATMPAGRRWPERELDLQIQLGQALIATEGYAAEPTARAFARAMVLADAVGETPFRFPAIYGQWAARYIRGEPSPELAAHFVSLAEQASDPGPRIVALRTLALERFHAGRFAETRRIVDEILTLYVPDVHRSLAFRYGHDPRAATLAYRAWTLWHLGFADQAQQASEAAVAWAEQCHHGNTTGYALCWGGLIPSVLQRRIARVEEVARHAIEVADELALPLWRGWSRIFLGWAQAHQGRYEAGLDEITGGLAEARRLAAARLLPFLLGLAAEAHVRGGRRDLALDTIGEAFLALEQTRDVAWGAHLYRIRGEIRGWGEATAAGAEADLLRSMEIARGQEARSLELRAATSLARIWAERGDGRAAAALLGPIHGWFTEGFATADLIEAKALLDRLSQGEG